MGHFLASATHPYVGGSISGNTLGHLYDNVELKIYMFSADATLSRKQFLLVFLNQTLVDLSPRVRALAQADYDVL